jgi:hypothetical protein
MPPNEVLSDGGRFAIASVTEVMLAAMATFVVDDPDLLARFISWSDQMPGLFTHECPKHHRVESIFVGGHLTAEIVARFIGAYIEDPLTLIEGYPIGDHRNG